MLKLLFVSALLRVRICTIPIKISKSNSDHFKGTLIFRHFQFVTILTFSYMFIRVFSFFCKCVYRQVVFFTISHFQVQLKYLPIFWGANQSIEIVDTKLLWRKNYDSQKITQWWFFYLNWYERCKLQKCVINLDVANANCRRSICCTNIFTCKRFLVREITNPKKRIRIKMTNIHLITKRQHHFSIKILDMSVYSKAKMAIWNGNTSILVFLKLFSFKIGIAKW